MDVNMEWLKCCYNCSDLVKKGCSGKTIAIGTGILLVLLLGWGGYGVWNVRTLPARAQQIIEDNARLLALLENTAPGTEKNKELIEAHKLNREAEVLRISKNYSAALARGRISFARGMCFSRTVYNNLRTKGELLVKTGDYNAGLVLYQKMLAIWPDDKGAAGQAQICRGKIVERKTAEDKAMVEFRKNTPKNMVGIPAGYFLMGSPKKEAKKYKDPYYGIISSDQPRHRVYLDAFYIDKYEVTVEEYGFFRIATGRENPQQPAWSTGKHPMFNVKWDDAVAYCKAMGKRLPTNAEWEKAARGGTNTLFIGGDNGDKIGDYAWYGVNSSSQAHPVGQKHPNNYGLYDMYGNAIEWVSDWYREDYYKNSPEKNPKGPSSGSTREFSGGGRVCRGGGWGSDLFKLLAASHMGLCPCWHDYNFGFRCAKGV